ncbi:MAG: hypothetical protein F4X97_02360 [Boseongicola sp. SB0662_bin_57]|nr:hypothetical protein [Boseongicola sp. SB0662_bin_57]
MGRTTQAQEDSRSGSPDRSPAATLARIPAAAILACGLVAHAGDATAQTAVCSDAPAAGERVECTEDSTSTDDIDILLEGVDIDVAATAINTHAVSARHDGSGDIDIDVTGGVDESGQAVRSAIDTSGVPQAYAVHGWHNGAGAVDIAVSGTTIRTTGRTGQAVHGLHHGTGRILLDVSDTDIRTTAKDGSGIYARHYSTDTEEGANANVSIEASSSKIVTEGQSAYGIWGASAGLGDVRITTTSNAVTTKGRYAAGIFGYHRGEGDLFVTSTHDRIVTENDEDDDAGIAIGIHGWHQLGNGDANVRVVGGYVRTAGTLAPGIVGQHARSGYVPVTTRGAVNVDVENSVIETTGRQGHGVLVRHAGHGAVRVATSGVSRITTTGADAHGIVTYHAGTGSDRSMRVTVGGSVEAKGAGADGVHVGRAASGNADRAAAFDGDGYRKQTVTVNGRIDSARGAGVFLAGGGKVFIGPSGRIDADSGVAILATGDSPGDSPEGPAVKPKLLVGMQPFSARAGSSTMVARPPSWSMT